jgi:tetratricopeptide (TPR) repeat protein
VRRLRPGFAPAPDEAQCIVTICRLLSGLPLGIELAAAWAPTRPLAELAQALAQRLHGLQSPLRDVPARHRSMAAVLDQSWRLLPGREQSVLRQLSVFRGGLTAAAAGAVATATPEELASLVDSSWLRLWPSGRYDLHELVRQYCAEKLESEHATLTGETPDQVRERHCTYFGSLIHPVVGQTNFQSSTGAELLADLGNLQAAWQWAILHGPLQVAMDVHAGIWYACDLNGWYRMLIEDWEAAVATLDLDLTPETPALRRMRAADLQGRILYALGTICSGAGFVRHERRAAHRLVRVLPLLPPGQARIELSFMARHLLEEILRDEGKFRLAYRLAGRIAAALQTRSLEYLYGRERSAKFWRGHAYADQAWCAWCCGDYANARRLVEQAIALRREMGEQRFLAYNLALLVKVLVTVGADMPAAEAAAAESLRLSSACGDRVAEAAAHGVLGQVAAAQGKLEQAEAEFQFSLATGRQTGDLFVLIDALVGLGRLELGGGHVLKAKALFEEVGQSLAERGTPDSAFGAPATLGLGWVALAEQHPAQAEYYFYQALALRRRAAFDTLDTLAGMGEVLRRQGKLEQAAVLFGYVAQHPVTADTVRTRVAESLAALGGSSGASAVPPSAVAAILGRPLALLGG